MALVNHIKREINAKIVYYGPERSGKTTSLRYVYDRIKPELRGDMKSVPASGSSLLFFDFSPFEQPVFGGYRIRLHIYTLQGRVANPAAWKMTLKGADGVVFVADCSEDGLSAAQQRVAELRDFLGSYGQGLDDLPVVLQINKIDLAGQVDEALTARVLAMPDCFTCTTNAVSGEGILKTLTSLSKIVMDKIAERDDLSRADSVGAEPTDQRTVAVDFHSAKLAGATIEQEGYEEPAERLRHDLTSDSTTKKDELPLVTISESDIHVVHGSICIPLKISSASGVQQLVISVSVATE